MGSLGSSPRRIRQKNVVAALQRIHACGQLSRAELARQLGLNRSSSGQIIAELKESGLVREVEGSDTRREGPHLRAGRPGIMLELISDAVFFLGVEIGVEHLASVAIDLSGQVCDRRTLPFDTPAFSIEAAVERAIALALEGFGPERLARCHGLGVSVPAHVRTPGEVSIAPIIGWRDVPFAAFVKAAFPADVPVVIENDANAFAIGDAYKHGRSGVTLVLVIETGVGGGILIDGQLFRGGHGLAGEIGHTLVPGSNGRKLEHLIGRETLVSQYRAVRGDASAGIEEFLDGVRDRVPEAVTIAEDWSRHLAYALMQACRLIDPNRIVLAGSVAPLFRLVAARVKFHMAQDPKVPFPSPDIDVDEDAEFGSAFGAACLLHQQFMSLDHDAGVLEPALLASQTTRSLGPAVQSNGGVS
jgi:predicted NBD/HSP70 family sugar kinase